MALQKIREAIISLLALFSVLSLSIPASQEIPSFFILLAGGSVPVTRLRVTAFNH